MFVQDSVMVGRIHVIRLRCVHGLQVKSCTFDYLNEKLSHLSGFSGFAGPIIGGILLDLEGYEYATGWIAFILAVGVSLLAVTASKCSVIVLVAENSRSV